MNKITPSTIVKFIILGSFLILVYKSKNQLFTPMDMSEYGEKYSKSQYVLGDAYEHEISDSDLYIYAGYAYWQGEDPTTINFEHPPLAKYFFGLSQLLFSNSLVLYVFLYPVILYLFYVLSKKILDTELARYIALITFATLPLFTQYFNKTILDIPMLAILLLFFLFLDMNSHNKGIKYALVGVMLGLLMSVKYPLPFIFIPFGALFLFTFLKQNPPPLILSWTLFKKKFYLPLISLVSAAIIYLAQYAVYFYHNHSLFTFFQFEKYRLNWWFGDRPTPKFLIFESLFTGKHESWWNPGSISVYEEWSILLPLLFCFSIVLFPWMKKNRITVILYLFSLVTLVGFGVGSGSSLRYLLIVVPFWILFAVSGIEQLLITHSKKISSKMTTGNNK